MDKLKGQLGLRGFIFWCLAVIVVASMFPTITAAVGSLLTNLTPGSPEYFLWQIFPFLFVLLLAVAFIYQGTPQQEQLPPQYR